MTNVEYIKDNIEYFKNLTEDDLKEDSIEVKKVLKQLQKKIRDVAEVMEYGKEKGASIEEVRETFIESYEDDLKDEKTSEYIFSNFMNNAKAGGLIKALMSKEPEDISNFNFLCQTILDNREKENHEIVSKIGAFKCDVDMVEILRKTIIDKLHKDVKKFERNGNEIANLKEYTDNTRKNIKEAIEDRIWFLDYYGVVDEIVEEANQAAREDGLNSISYKRRVAPVDNYVIGEGETAETVQVEFKDLEDVGVIESEYYMKDLNEYGPLLSLALYWDNLYNMQRGRITDAIPTIDDLDLWDAMVKGDESDIDKLDDDTISSLSKKLMILRYMPERNITEEAEEIYRSFLENEKLSGGTIEDEQTKRERYDCVDFNSMQSYHMWMQRVLLDNIKSKAIKANDWGVVGKGKDVANIAIDFESLRGPIVMKVHKDVPKEEGIRNYGNKNYAKSEYAKKSIPVPTTNAFKKGLQVDIKDGNIKNNGLKVALEAKAKAIGGR